MRQNGDAEEGFRKRKYSRKKSRKGPTFKWVRTPIGRTAKILIGLIGDQLTHRSSILTRKFSEQGANPPHLYGELIRILPWFPAYFLCSAGYDLTPKIVYDRYHKMCYKNGPAGEGGKPAVSGEHYLHCRFLRPRVPTIEKIFRSGRPITIDEALDAGK